MGNRNFFLTLAFALFLTGCAEEVPEVPSRTTMEDFCTDIGLVNSETRESKDTVYSYASSALKRQGITDQYYKDAFAKAVFKANLAVAATNLSRVMAGKPKQESWKDECMKRMRIEMDKPRP